MHNLRLTKHGIDDFILGIKQFNDLTRMHTLTYVYSKVASQAGSNHKNIYLLIVSISVHIGILVRWTRYLFFLLIPMKYGIFPLLALAMFVLAGCTLTTPVENTEEPTDNVVADKIEDADENAADEVEDADVEEVVE